MAYGNPKGIIAGSMVSELLATTCVGLRFYSRYRAKAHVIASDWVILAAVLIGTGLTVLEIYGMASKSLASSLDATFAKPIENTKRLHEAERIETAFICIGVVAIGLVKISVVLLYRRIFDRPRSFRILLSFWTVVLLLWPAVFTIAGLLQCGRDLKATLSSHKDYFGDCENVVPIGYALVVSDVATNLVTLLLPLPMIWRLQMQTSKRVELVALFMVGLLSVGASIAKAYFYIAATKGQDVLDAILCNILEVKIGAIAACGTTLRQPLGSITTQIRQSVIHIHQYVKWNRGFRQRLDSSRSTATDAATGAAELK